jgi:hypothetical protein
MSSRFSDFIGRVTSGTRSFKTLVYIVIKEGNIKEEGAKWRENIGAFCVIEFMEDVFEAF